MNLGPRPKKNRGLERGDSVADAARRLQELVPLESDEVEIAHAMVWEGPAPALLLLGGGELFFREYFLQLTSLRLILMRFSQLSDKPTKQVYAVDRGKLAVERWKRGAGGWSSLWLRWPGQRRVLRLNLDPTWEPEADKIRRELVTAR